MTIHSDDARAVNLDDLAAHVGVYVITTYQADTLPAE
jgi:hypothetical protein